MLGAKVGAAAVGGGSGPSPSGSVGKEEGAHQATINRGCES